MKKLLTFKFIKDYIPGGIHPYTGFCFYRTFVKNVIIGNPVSGLYIFFHLGILTRLIIYYK